jgi:hypothetical protein
LLLGKVPVDANHIYGFAVKYTIREVLDAIYCLGPGDAAADHCYVGGIKANVKLEMCCHVAEPRFAAGNREDAGKSLVLYVHTLLFFCL